MPESPRAVNPQDVLWNENKQMRAALGLCDRYFMALAAAWGEAVGLSEMMEEAAEATRRVLHPEEFADD